MAETKVDFNELAAGVAIQVATATSTAAATGTTVIPYDDTIPQITEGTEFLTITITPKTAASILVVEAKIQVAQSNAGNLIAALFQDAGANALDVSCEYKTTASTFACLKIRFPMVAGSTASTTFRLRAGPSSSGTITFNGEGGARKFGAIQKSSLTVTEYKQ